MSPFVQTSPENKRLIHYKINNNNRKFNGRSQNSVYARATFKHIFSVCYLKQNIFALYEGNKIII